MPRARMASTDKRDRMSRHYDISRYDKNLCLKPSISMWLISLFLLRPYLVLVLSVVNRKDRMALIELVYPDRLGMSLGALAGIPAAILVYAWLRRAPGATGFVRKAWLRGRMLLTISALGNLALVSAPLWTGRHHVMSVTGWIQTGILLVILFVLYASPYIRDCFADFPEQAEPDAG